MPISQQNISFLKELSQNNNREWFAENKSSYEEAHQNMIAFSDDVLTLMNQHDNLETVNGKKSLYRIYRDVRFSKDKSPYKSHWGAYYKRATSMLRGGYGIRIAPGATIVGGGFWGPNKDDLLHIRNQIAQNPEELRNIINSKKFISNFGKLEGEQLKTAPKGFPKNHEAIELLRYKQFLLSKSFSDKEVMSSDFALKVDITFKAMRPFFNYMSDILTTDLNGEVLKEFSK